MTNSTLPWPSVTSGRDARAPREDAGWERGRLARILGLQDERLCGLKVFCQTPVTHGVTC